LENEGDRNR